MCHTEGPGPERIGVFAFLRPFPQQFLFYVELMKEKTSDQLF